MRMKGWLLIIWGGALVPLTLPWTWGYTPQRGFIASLGEMTLRVMGEGVSYAGVVSLAVFLVGLGLTLLARDAEAMRERSRERKQWMYETAIHAALSSGDDL